MAVRLPEWLRLKGNSRKRLGACQRSERIWISCGHRRTPQTELGIRRRLDEDPAAAGEAGSQKTLGKGGLATGGSDLSEQAHLASGEATTPFGRVYARRDPDDDYGE